MYKEVESFSSPLGKVVMQELVPGKATPYETLKLMSNKGRFIVLCEKNGKLSVRNFHLENHAYDLWSDLAYELNPQRPAKKESRVLRESYNTNGSGKLNLLALWNTKYAVHVSIMDSRGNLGNEVIVKRTYKDALAVYEQKQKELWPELQKQK